MAIVVCCETKDCRKRLRVRDELSGKRIKCPGCGHLQMVPRKDGDSEAAVPSSSTMPLGAVCKPTTEPSRSLSQAISVNRRSYWSVVAVSGGIVLLLCAVIFVEGFQTSGRSQSDLSISTTQSQQSQEPTIEVSQESTPEHTKQLMAVSSGDQMAEETATQGEDELFVDKRPKLEDTIAQESANTEAQGPEKPIAPKPENAVGFAAVDHACELGRFFIEVRRYEVLIGPSVRWVISTDIRYALAISEDRLSLWDVGDRRELRKLKGPSTTTAIFSPDSRYVLSATSHGAVRLWDVERGEEIRGPETHCFDSHLGHAVTCLAFSSDSRFALSAAANKVIVLWDIERGRELRRFEGNAEAVCCMSFSPSGKLALSGGGDSVRLWDVSTGKQLSRLEGNRTHAVGATFSTDGRQLLISHSDKTITLWETETGKQLYGSEWQTKWVQQMVKTPRGQPIHSNRIQDQQPAATTSAPSSSGTYYFRRYIIVR